MYIQRKQTRVFHNITWFQGGSSRKCASIFVGGKKCNASPKHPERLWGPSGLLCNGHRRAFSQIRRPGREANSSHPYNDKVKSEWRYTKMECTGTTARYFYLFHQALQVKVFIVSHHIQQIIVYFMTFLIHTCALLVYRAFELCKHLYWAMHLSSNREMHSELLTYDAIWPAAIQIEL